MRAISLIFAIFISALFATHASPTGAIGDNGFVEIEKQRLVKFPDESEQQEQLRHDPPSTKEKHDEAKRILEEIEKINQSLGYVKKQSEQKVPPMLDSTQYLFPKPAYQPFHAQSHQISGSNGEILLVPSIRAVKFDRSYKRKPESVSKVINYNVPPHSKSVQQTTAITAATTMTVTTPATVIRKGTHQKKQKPQLYFRPNQVHVPAPQNDHEQQQLPTHFVIPVRLYKLNMEEYLQKIAPQEYRVKGYKIMGDIDHFYGKAKAPAKHKNGGKHQSKKSTPKYHLFFLPRELALNTDSTLKQREIENDSQSHDMGSREEKLANRPFKVQTTSSTGTNGTLSSTQFVRKRIVPKPIRNKETNINSLATQQLSDGSSATSATTVHITPPTLSQASGSAANVNSGIVNIPQSVSPNKNTFNLISNRPALNALINNNAIRPNNNANMNNNNNNNNNNPLLDSNMNNATAANAIKIAFQNFFKLPFRQDAKPVNVGVIETPATDMESVPLQTPQKTFFAAQPLLPLPPLPFYQSDPMVPAPTKQHNNEQSGHDYKWEDESANSGGDTEYGSPEETEKQIFGHRHKQQQETQKEAIKQGGIIIQRLKVRKGGIAIAGPGGVATAGSGGTAIVGPGGYALTHPRSLTIAGPGAKVIAIPADVDLKDALQRTNLDLKTFPREGKVVATGPTVYYSPATGTTSESD